MHRLSPPSPIQTSNSLQIIHVLPFLTKKFPGVRREGEQAEQL